MRRFLARTFVVEASPSATWDRLVRVEDWPSWAKHIESAELVPPGPLGPTTTGVFRLKPFLRARFAVVTFRPGEGWLWRGKFLWMTVDYDHHLEPAPGRGTRVTFTVDGRGLGQSTLGRVFARAYGKNLDKAIANLVESLRSAPPAAGRITSP